MVAGRDPSENKENEFVIFGFHTFQGFDDGHQERSSVFAYDLKHDGQLIAQACRDGQMRDRIQGKVEVTDERLYMALNIADGDVEFPKHAKAGINSDSARNVNYYVFARDTWSEAEKKQSRVLDQLVPPDPIRFT